MSTSIPSVIDALVEACQSVRLIGSRVHRQAGPVLSAGFPAVVLGPIAPEWESYCINPSSGRMLVYVIESVDDHTLDRVYAAMLAVTEAIQEQVDDASVISALPASYATGAQQLPCYEITVEVALGG